jgi:hypothetical protein
MRRFHWFSFLQAIGNLSLPVSPLKADRLEQNFLPSLVQWAVLPHVQGDLWYFQDKAMKA